MVKFWLFITAWLVLPQLPRLLGWGVSGRRLRQLYPVTGWARVNHAPGAALGLALVVVLTLWESLARGPPPPQ